jgi:hypothetical protein
MTYKTNVNGQTRKMTDEEIAQYELMLAEIEQQKQNDQINHNRKQAAKNKLASLGLTPEEIDALIP